jgi:hypothetical protein
MPLQQVEVGVVAGTQRGLGFGIEAHRRHLARVQFDAVLQLRMQLQRQHEIVVAEQDAATGAEQQRQVPAATRPGAGHAVAMASDQVVERRAMLRYRRRQGVLDALPCGGVDMPHRRAAALAMFAQQARLRRGGVRRPGIVDHGQRLRRKAALRVPMQGIEQTLQLRRTIAGTDVQATRVGARRRGCGRLDVARREILGGDDQAALDQPVEDPADAVERRTRHHLADRLDVFVGAAEFATTIQRRQHLMRHHVRHVLMTRAENALAIAEVGDLTRQSREHGRVRIELGLGRHIEIEAEFHDRHSVRGGQTARSAARCVSLRRFQGSGCAPWPRPVRSSGQPAPAPARRARRAH